MSHYDWESGTFKLPSAEFASFRQAMQDVDDRIKQAAFEHTQTFWRGLTRKQQTDPAAYQAATHAWYVAQYDAIGRRPASGFSAPGQASEAKAALELAAWKLHSHSYAAQPPPPKRVLKEDMDFPTNRTLVCEDDGATVAFDKDAKTVTWSSGNNNNQVERARSSALGQAFFRRLATVRWTHGTGGVIVGNDEYNRDDRVVSGGGNYCTGAYGYLGIAQEPAKVQPFINARGQHVSVQLKAGRHGIVGKAVHSSTPLRQGRQPAGIPVGGQFAAARHGRSGVTL